MTGAMTSLVLAFTLAGLGCSKDESAAGAAGAAAPHTAASSSPSAAAGSQAAAVTAPSAKQKQAPPRPAELKRVTIKALGMYCEESCPVKVRYALADLTAVYELGFDLSTESIFVSYDAALGPAPQVTKPMIAAIKQAGFDPWLGKESWPEGAKTQVVLR